MTNLQKTIFPIRLNKYLAKSGFCSRRKADEIINSGLIKINDQIVFDPFYRVSESDVVLLSGIKIILPSLTNYIYLVFNKPKNVIVTKSDPQGRKTIFDMIPEFDKNIRLFSVGRLDRNTTGILLLTNDGDLSNKLMHPSNNVSKIYKVTLDKGLSTIDSQKLLTGVSLHDGISKFDSLTFFTQNSYDHLIVCIHSGKNRIIRRMFENLNYNVKSLDRLSFAGIEKKNLKPGSWRYLNSQEIIKLKHLVNPFSSIS